jgi:hypothetical protein
MKPIEDLTLAELEALAIAQRRGSPFDAASLGELEVLAAANGVGAGPAATVTAVKATLGEAEALANDVIANPTGAKVKELSGRAASAIMASPEIRSRLSADSLGILSGLTSAAEAVAASVNVSALAAASRESVGALAGAVAQQAVAMVLAKAPEWAQQAALKAASAAGETANQALQDVAAAGSVFTAALSAFWAIGDALSRARDEQMQIYMKWMAAQREEVFGQVRDKILMAPNPSGANGQIVPADMFAWQTWFPRYTRKAKGGKPLCLRPLVGSALIKLTESGLDTCPARKNSDVGDPGSCDLEQPAGGFVVFAPIDRPHYEMWIGELRRKRNDQRLGIPEERRRVFRLLRRAITAQRGQKGTDGGLTLWPIYVDLLVREFDEGHLSEEALDDMLHDTITWDFDDPKKKFIGQEQTTYRPSAAVPAIIDIVRRWRNTARPTYAQDAADHGKTVELIQRLSTIAALSQTAQPVPQALLIGLPPEVRSGLKVAVQKDYGALFLKRQAERRRAAEDSSHSKLLLPGLALAGALAGVYWLSRSG